MNILEAYILQKKRLTIVISSLDLKSLKEIGENIANDLSATLIDLSDEMFVDKISDIDLKKVNSKDTDNTIKIIICPFFPGNLFDIRINYHINISLNKTKISEKNIDERLINLNNEITDSLIINKFLNQHKYENNKKIEDDIFELIMKFIQKKLDNGKYSEKVKLSEKVNLSKTIKDEDENDNDIVGKKLKEMESNPKNNKIDDDIMEDIELSSQDPLSDSNISEISVEDINIDNDLTPVKEFTDTSAFYEEEIDSQYGGIINKLTESVSEFLIEKITKNQVIGSRKLKVSI